MRSGKIKSQRKGDADSPRANTGLSENFECRLAAYAMAAGVAGVGLLAAAPPANAEVVYTPAHIVFNSGTVYLDLNHDGINDFALSIYNFDSEIRRLGARGLAAQNGVLCSGSSGYPPLALKAGSPIGGNGLYGTFDRRAAPAVDVVASKFGDYVGGPFANVRDRFLGLKFNINGKAHYGWALLEAEAGVFDHGPKIKATLLGYAYDTVAGQTIDAGGDAADGEKSKAIPEAGSLGMLALGWPAWRRREQDANRTNLF
jgi:hypothetical protein